MTEMRNSNRCLELEKRYNVYKGSDMSDLDRDVTVLTFFGAQLSIKVGSHTVILKVFCRMDDTSKVYKIAIRNGFKKV